jgi:hypothetical protein
MSLADVVAVFRADTTQFTAKVGEMQAHRPDVERPRARKPEGPFAEADRVSRSVVRLADMNKATPARSSEPGSPRRRHAADGLGESRRRAGQAGDHCVPNPVSHVGNRGAMGIPFLVHPLATR